MFTTVFFSGHSANDTTATCPTDPDIAGIGVVLSFALGAAATTIVSIVLAILGGLSDNGDSGTVAHLQPTARRRRWLAPRHPRVRAVLERLILALADQQLATGVALLVAGGVRWARDPFFDNSVHATLLIELCCLSSSSHLAGIIHLKKTYFRRHRALCYFRIALVATFGLFLSLGLFYINNPLLFQLLRFIPSAQPQKAESYLIWVLPVMVVYYTFYLALMQLAGGRDSPFARFGRQVWQRVRKGVTSSVCISQGGPKTRLTRWAARVFWFFFVGHPAIVCASQVLFAILALFFALQQKFTHAPPEEEKYNLVFCDLTSGDDNSWGFGQLLAMLLLLLPLLQAAEVVSEQRNDDKRKDASADEQRERFGIYHGHLMDRSTRDAYDHALPW